jgi:hypothetical protein
LFRELLYGLQQESPVSRGLLLFASVSSSLMGPITLLALLSGATARSIRDGVLKVLAGGERGKRRRRSAQGERNNPQSYF